MSWQALAEAAPELATFGAERLHDQVSYLATIKPDGAPRLSPVRPVVTGRRLSVFTDRASPKVRDLESDARYALHGTATSDQPWDLREFAVEGTARRVEDSNVRTAANAGCAFPRDDRFLLFELDVNAAVSTMYRPDGRPPAAALARFLTRAIRRSSGARSGAPREPVERCPNRVAVARH